MNRRKLSLMAIAMGLLLAAFAAPRVAPASQASPRAQVVLEPVTMAWVSSAEPDVNFGGRGYVWVGYGHGTGDTLSALRGLVKFDLSGVPSDAVVTEARLYATIIDAQGPPDHFLYCPGRPSVAWDETTVTWNSKPGMLGGSPCIDLSATAGQIAWDVTTAVQEIHGGLVPNDGFYLVRMNDETDPQEHARLFHKLSLVVRYEVSTPTTTPAPLVEITKSDDPDPVAPGGEVHYTITLRNPTGEVISRLLVRDTIPASTTFVEATDGGVFNGDRTVAWLIQNLPAGGTRSVRLTLRVWPNAPSGVELTDTASVTYRCSAEAGSLENDVCSQETSETTLVSDQAQMLPTSTSTPVSCLPDEAGDDIVNATEFPSGVRGVRASICPSGDEDWFKFLAHEGDLIMGRLYNLPANYQVELWWVDGSRVATFTSDGLADVPFSWRVEPGRDGWWRARVWSPDGAFSQQPYSLMIWTRASTPVPTLTPTPTRTTTPTRTPTPTTPVRINLDIEKTLITSGPITPNQDVEYRITVRNSSDTPARQVIVWDILPRHATFVSASPEATYDGDRTVTWPTQDRLNPGAQVTYRLTLHVTSDTPDGYVLSNWAEVRAENAYQTQDDASVTISGRPPQLHVSKRTMSLPPRGGEDFTYEITVSNEGEGPAYNVVVWDEDLPAPFVSADHNGSYDSSTHKVTWPTIPTLNPGESRTYHLTVHFPDDIAHNSIVTNKAYADADNAGRAQATSSGNVWNPPDLIADALEVTQGVQDLNNSVVLIKGKRTYVRFHVHSDHGNISGVTARLWRWADGRRLEPGLAPSNSGGTITIVPNPDRADLNDSFYFELPDSWVDEDLIAGTQVLEAEVNYDDALAESNDGNNVARTGVLHFEDTPPLKVRLYRVAYRDDNGHLHTTDSYHYPYIENWLRQAY
ncbi:MAG: DUF11 domain-containing protein, partial [Chloroflexi bacterium]|nr:DUF11 domain-containing protein [Chloroflexota bacterium]